jgi:hypothetical protein
MVPCMAFSSGYTHQAAKRGDRHDAAAAARDHRRDDGPDRPEGAEVVHPYLPLELRIGDFHEVPGPDDPGAGEQHIARPVRIDAG